MVDVLAQSGGCEVEERELVRTSRCSGRVGSGGGGLEKGTHTQALEGRHWCTATTRLRARGVTEYLTQCTASFKLNNKVKGLTAVLCAACV